MKALGLYLVDNEKLSMLLEYLTETEHMFFEWKRLQMIGTKLSLCSL